jgi:hypothetical protein
MTLSRWAAGFEQHGEHWDWYRLHSTVVAKDEDPANDVPRHLTNPPGGFTSVMANHIESKRGLPKETWRRRSALGSLPVTGSTAAYNPATGTLLLLPGAVDILDREGGCTGSVDPVLGNDAALKLRIQPIEMLFVGYDPEFDDFVFQGGQFLAENPDADPDEAHLVIRGTLGQTRILAAAPPGNDACEDGIVRYAGFFERLGGGDVIDEDEGPSSPWADEFVRTALFGEGLSNDELTRLAGPMLTFTADVDLVEVTKGFSLPAEVPATILLTIAFEAAAPCLADCNADGVINIFDFLCFQGKVTTGDPAADCNADGVLNIFDFLCFQGAVTQGCP